MQSEIIKKKFTYRRNPKHPIFITGTYGYYTYKAKVLNDPITEGIANGRVIQLKVLSNGLELVFYDEGWYYGKDYLSIYVPIVKKLERIKRKEGVKNEVGITRLDEPILYRRNSTKHDHL